MRVVDPSRRERGAVELLEELMRRKRREKMGTNKMTVGGIPDGGGV